MPGYNRYGFYSIGPLAPVAPAPVAGQFPRFSARLFRDTATFVLGQDEPNFRGGITKAYPTGTAISVTLPAYIETTSGDGSRGEAQQRPLASRGFRVFTRSDPSATLGRRVQADDRVLAVLAATPGTPVKLKVIAPPEQQGQGALWVTKCDMTS